MNHIQQTFERCRREGKAAYVAYLTMGAPTLAKSLAAAETLIGEGADILELGVPFSDPVADGAVIRRAADAALKNGVTLADVLAEIPALRRRHPDTAGHLHLLQRDFQLRTQAFRGRGGCVRRGRRAGGRSAARGAP